MILIYSMYETMAIYMVCFKYYSNGKHHASSEQGLEATNHFGI